LEAEDLPPELASEGASSDDGLFLEAMGAMGESFSSSSSAAMGAEETMLGFSPWVERRAFVFCSFSLLEPFFLFFELRGGGFKADLFSLSSSAKGEGKVARAEGEAEVALGSSALARAGEEKDADAGAAAAFSSSSSAAMGAEESMLLFSTWIERRDFFFCSFSLLEPFFLFFELGG